MRRVLVASRGVSEKVMRVRRARPGRRDGREPSRSRYADLWQSRGYDSSCATKQTPLTRYIITSQIPCPTLSIPACPSHPQQKMSSSRLHQASLVPAATHSSALLELVDQKLSRPIIGKCPSFTLLQVSLKPRPQNTSSTLS